MKKKIQLQDIGHVASLRKMGEQLTCHFKYCKIIRTFSQVRQMLIICLAKFLSKGHYQWQNYTV